MYICRVGGVHAGGFVDIIEYENVLIARNDIGVYEWGAGRAQRTLNDEGLFVKAHELRRAFRNHFPSKAPLI